MAELRRRLTRLERSAAELVPDQQHCPACQGRGLVAFCDELDNTGPRHPYDGPDGTCRLCRMPPPGTNTLRLPAPIGEYFAALPWSDQPRTRFVEKLTLLTAIAKRDTQEAERSVRLLYERDHNGPRHWRQPEDLTYAQDHSPT